jgi:hypothetical protein
MLSTAGQTGNDPANLADAREIVPAIRTTVNETPATPCYREGQSVAAVFVADPKILARAAPFPAMRENSPSAGAKLGQEMRKFVEKSSIDFGVALGTQERIQRN